MRIKSLREFYNVQQKELASFLGISPNTLSQYETGKREPGIEIISKISEYFNVSTDYIYGLSSITTCKKCGLTYDPMNTTDSSVHNELHTKWEYAVKKYGTIYSNCVEMEKVKAKNRNIVNSKTASLEERYNAQLLVFRCLFSRSLDACNYNDKHIDFVTYVSMLLNQEHFRKIMDKDLYQKCVREFGVSAGISSGTYYDIHSLSNKTETVAAHLDGNDYTEEQWTRIKSFAEFIKQENK